MTCDRTNSIVTDARFDKSCAGEPSAEANGRRPGCEAWPRHVAELHRIGSTRTPVRNGSSATVASLATGDECCTGNCRQGRDCHERTPMINADRGGMRLMAVLLIVFWACIAMALRACVEGRS